MSLGKFCLLNQLPPARLKPTRISDRPGPMTEFITLNQHIPTIDIWHQLTFSQVDSYLSENLPAQYQTDSPISTYDKREEVKKDQTRLPHLTNRKKQKCRMTEECSRPSAEEALLKSHRERKVTIPFSDFSYLIHPESFWTPSFLSRGSPFWLVRTLSFFSQDSNPKRTTAAHRGSCLYVKSVHDIMWLMYNSVVSGAFLL